MDEETFVAVLKKAIDAVERAGIPYATMGGIAATALGRHRYTHDIDLFVKPEDAGRALDALDEAGFKTDRTNDHWIYKGWMDDLCVDVIFRARGDIALDDEMLARVTERDFHGVTLRVVPPEDLIVIKAIVHDEESPRHWYDALGTLTSNEIDWDYLLRRAVKGPRRVLALLLYAASDDLLVSEAAIRELFAQVYPS